MGMKDITPYSERPAGEIERERRCMEAVFAKAGEVSYVYEAFGGFGVTARELRKRFPSAFIEATDLDAECVEKYRRKVPGPSTSWLLNALSFVEEKLPFRAWNHESWGASLDYNKFTMLDLTTKRNKWKTDLLSAVVDLSPSWLQLTDSAVRYLHLNFASYGCGTPSLEEYVEKLDDTLYSRYGMRVVVMSNHSAATYLLLEFQ